MRGSLTTSCGHLLLLSLVSSTEFTGVMLRWVTSGALSSGVCVLEAARSRLAAQFHVSPTIPNPLSS
uniref:Secreted protein n=1 Tax=Knipowitschia caucasica TaxID=637954 RepID=A0AAV2KE91_KNICA